MLAMLTVLVVTIAGCLVRPAAPPAPPADSCTAFDGPTPGTVARTVAAIPPPPDRSRWTVSADGHTGDCRLHWVKLTPVEATPGSPEQLVFFDHDAPLGSPTADPKPYTTVLASGADTVTVQYQWRVADDPECCPTGAAITRYRICAGRLTALDPIPRR